MHSAHPAERLSEDSTKYPEGEPKLRVNRERRLSLILNENIKAIRKSKGLSQQELAVRLNIVRQTVSKWEQGGRS